MNKHTPTPWSLSLSDNATPHIMHGNHQGYEDREHLVCWMPAEITRQYNSLENAKHIVRCVNSHEALVEALRKITNLEHKLYGTDWEEITEAQNIAASALIAAGAQ